MFNLFLTTRKKNLQLNTMFHLGGFLSPIDALIKKFSLIFINNTEFSGLNIVFQML